LASTQIQESKRLFQFCRRTFLKLLLSLSGLVAFLPFLKYGSYLSPEPAVVKRETENRTEKVTETKTATNATPVERVEIKFERTRIANLSEIPPGSAKTFVWPEELGYNGTNILVRDDSGNLYAYNALCPHLRCQVAFYYPFLACPCHGSVFKAETGEVLGGPSKNALPLIKLEVDEGGDIYAVGHEGDFGYGRPCRTKCGP
jgi:rieske iron-sulfur protein